LFFNLTYRHENDHSGQYILKKVLFLTRSLNLGGAERQLLTLMQAMDRNRIEPVLVTFYSEGELLSSFKSLKIKIRSAQKKGRWDLFPFLVRLIRIISQEKPDVILSYLVAANLLAIFFKPFFYPTRIAISIRHSFIRKEDYDWLSSLLYSIEDRIAKWSDLIIVNSSFGAIKAQERGIPKGKMVIIPNGIDTIKFHSDLVLRKKKRKDLEIQDSSILIGLIGRLDPAKNHIGFIEAASSLGDKTPPVRFIIVGNGTDEYRQSLIQKIKEYHLEESFTLASAEVDPVPIYNALDICVSSSIGEGFSNVIAEAMSCEIPCVVTDVGDSAKIVGQTGLVIKPDNEQDLANALLSLINLEQGERKDLGKKARERIISEFSVEKMVFSTMQELERLG
jgi:glycosyltransferase involved in cell wall biosynthesis